MYCARDPILKGNPQLFNQKCTEKGKVVPKKRLKSSYCVEIDTNA